MSEKHAPEEGSGMPHVKRQKALALLGDSDDRKWALVAGHFP